MHCFAASTGGDEITHIPGLELVSFEMFELGYVWSRLAIIMKASDFNSVNLDDMISSSM